MAVYFKTEDVMTEAQSGDVIMEVGALPDPSKGGGSRHFDLRGRSVDWHVDAVLGAVIMKAHQPRFPMPFPYLYNNTPQVAERCGITIPGGCYSGNCGICEVEVTKFSDAAAAAAAAGSSSSKGAVVRACVARLPPGYARVEIESLQDDAIWGLDGFDT